MSAAADRRPSALEAPGDHYVDAPVFCALTRFGLKGARHLAPTYRDFRAVMRAADDTEVPGLLKAAFLVENPTTCYSLSIWSQEPAFSAPVPYHVDVARRVFGRLASDSDHGPELWSTKWRLNSVTNNLNWDGFDLRRVIAAAETQP